LSPPFWLGIFIERAYTPNPGKRWKCPARKHAKWLSMSLIDMEQPWPSIRTIQYKEELVHRETSLTTALFSCSRNFMLQNSICAGKVWGRK
jgi:hypothetical protein